MGVAAALGRAVAALKGVLARGEEVGGARGEEFYFRTVQLMCYRLRKHEDSTGEISTRKP